MGRRRRCIIPGERYHITHRGNHREAILSDDESRAMYMSIMRRWQLKTGVEVGDDDARAFLDVGAGNALTEPATCTSDDGDFLI